MNVFDYSGTVHEMIDRVESASRGTAVFNLWDQGLRGLSGNGMIGKLSEKQLALPARGIPDCLTIEAGYPDTPSVFEIQVDFTEK